ncbi:MAG: metal ABC transporter substrate-binding protein [Planctomycetota bacterium]|nr:metal ABC transporter substrate-binding protein [Planctomycetota bacterium]
MTAKGDMARVGLSLPLAAGVFVVGVGAMIGVSVSNAQRGAEARVMSASDAAGGMRVVATVPPLAWVARALAPAGSEITMLVPGGVACHGLELTPSQVGAIRRADVTLTVGFGLDRAVDEAGAESGARVEMASVDACAAGHDLAQGEEARHECEHGDEHGHGHAHGDPHVWLDPVLMGEFVERVAGEMETALRARGGSEADIAALRARSEAARAVCAEIDAAYRERLGPFEGRAIVTYHDAYGRVAERYGLRVAAVIQHSHEAEPAPGDVAAAARAVREERVGAIFIEPQFSRTVAERIAAESGASVYTLDPLGSGDWPGLMRANLESLVRGLEAGR